jgi:hypothetical protein
VRRRRVEIEPNVAVRDRRFPSGHVLGQPDPDALQDNGQRRAARELVIGTRPGGFERVHALRGGQRHVGGQPLRTTLSGRKILGARSKSLSEGIV